MFFVTADASLGAVIGHELFECSNHVLDFLVSQSWLSVIKDAFHI